MVQRDYKELWQQLCSSKKHFCSRCPLNEICDNGEVFIYNKKNLEAIVKKWHDERTTYASDFLNKFPHAELFKDGTPVICREQVYGIPCDEELDCDACWNEKMEK